jgi:hypothetical protein
MVQQEINPMSTALDFISMGMCTKIDYIVAFFAKVSFLASLVENVFCF